MDTKEMVFATDDPALAVTLTFCEFADEVTLKQADDVIVLNPEDARELADAILDNTEAPELTKEERKMLDGLIAKWGYKPETRHMNVAGFKKASQKQVGYIFRLAQRSTEDYEAFRELSFIVEKHNGISPARWLSADAMFIINGLTRGERAMRGEDEAS